MKLMHIWNLKEIRWKEVHKIILKFGNSRYKRYWILNYKLIYKLLCTYFLLNSIMSISFFLFLTYCLSCFIITAGEDPCIGFKCGTLLIVNWFYLILNNRCNKFNQYFDTERQRRIYSDWRICKYWELDLLICYATMFSSHTCSICSREMVDMIKRLQTLLQVKWLRALTSLLFIDKVVLHFILQHNHKYSNLGSWKIIR